MSIPLRREANPLFGKPTLSAANNGLAVWIRGSTSPLDQKGSTGWLARLYGGIQTNDDWARLNIPVDEIFVSDFNSALWSWYQTDAQTMGLGIVIWVHDPKDSDKRAEITQLGGHADLPKVSGWNAFAFSPTTGGMFFYGEGTTGTGLTAGTQYTWSQFQADVLFKNWTIYRITLDWGWEASGTFNYVYVADVKLNGVAVSLRPNDPLVDSDGHPQIDVIGALPAGTNLLGKVGIDQSTTNANEVVLKAGTALAGKVGIDQATANANEVVVKSGTVTTVSTVSTVTGGKIGHDKTGIGHGVMTVTTAGTDLVLAASTAAKVVIIQAQTDNTGAIAIGATGVDATIATGTGILLYAGDWTPPLEIDNLADIFVDATVSGEGVRYIYLT